MTGNCCVDDGTSGMRASREVLIKHLREMVSQNAFAILAVHAVQNTREKYVGWEYEDELPEGYDLAGNYERSRIIDGVRMYPTPMS